MASQRRPGGPFERARPQHGADARHNSRGGDHPRPRRRGKAVGRNRRDPPMAKTGAHHHGPVESVIYVVSGRARMRWGDRLEFVAEAGPGDFIYVPPYVPHQEINASDDAPLSCVIVRSGQEAVVVNLDLPNVEPNPQPVEWVDDLHPPRGNCGGRLPTSTSSGLACRGLASVLVPLKGEAFVELRKRELDADLR